MDNFVNLLFLTDEAKERWDNTDRHIYDITNHDLGIEAITSELVAAYADFPAYILEYPCLTMEDAAFRGEIIDEVYHDGEIFNALTACIDKLTILKLMNSESYFEKHDYQKKFRFLNLMRHYIDCVNYIAENISECKSNGLKRLLDFAKGLQKSADFIKMTEDAYALHRDLEALRRLDVVINHRETKYMVTQTDPDATNLAEEIYNDALAIFGIKIKNAFPLNAVSEMTPMEEAMLEHMISSHPDHFDRLNAFCEYFKDLSCYNLIELIPNIVFYTGYADMVKKLESEGYAFCKAVFSDEGYFAEGAYELGLAIMAVNEKRESRVVSNTINLKKGETFILSGPNQGGKTVYLKTAGIIAQLARCGCLVPCTKCTLPFYSLLYTHFPRQELIGKGRLIEEIERIESKLPMTASDSLLLFNESFASTRRSDGMDISMYYLEKLENIGCSVGFVTHFYELPATYKNGDNKLKSLVAAVSSESDSTRTYRIIECPPSGIAYAKDIAERCGVTFENLMAICEKTEAIEERIVSQ